MQPEQTSSDIAVVRHDTELASFLSSSEVIDWYRVDARGDKSGINTAFSPPAEQLAFSATLLGEVDLPEVWPEPLPVVVNALRKHVSVQALRLDLPDVPVIKSL